MYIGELFLALTLATVIIAMFVKDDGVLPFATLAMIQWVGFNFLKEYAGWYILPNQLIDLIVLFLAYALWYLRRDKLAAVFCFLLVGRVLWHAIAISLDLRNTYEYAFGNNFLYAVELAVINGFALTVPVLGWVKKAKWRGPWGNG